MNIIVLVKEVPDMEKVRFDNEKGLVDRSSADTEINPFDLNAVQTAIDIKKINNAFITAISMGPPKAEKSLRDAYARGADRVVLLTDMKFGGSDTWATSSTLAAGIRAAAPYDLIICGEKSVDGDTAQVGAEVAEILGIPHSYYVEEINSISENEIEVTIDNICGMKQIRKMKLPAVISVTKNINKAELPTVKRKLQSLKVKVDKMGFLELSSYVKEDGIGIKGSPTRVLKIQIPKEEVKDSHIYRDDYTNFKKDIFYELKKINIL